MPFHEMQVERGQLVSADRRPGVVLNGTLHLEQLLLEEFNYAGQTAYQADEDRDIEQFAATMPGSEKAFRWRLRTIPTGEKLLSITFLFYRRQLGKRRERK